MHQLKLLSEEILGEDLYQLGAGWARFLRQSEVK